MAEKLIYQELGSLVNPSFWNKLTEIKVNIDKLNEKERHIWGYFPLLKNKDIRQPLVEVDSTSFNEEFSSQHMFIPFEGKIINKNTIEAFKECNKMDLILENGNNLYQLIESGAALNKPSALNRFFVLSFADVKKYHYYYWFAFPVLKNLVIEKTDCKVISEEFSTDIRQSLYSQFKSLEDYHKTYFIVERKEDCSIKVESLDKIGEISAESIGNFYFAFLNISTEYDTIGPQLRNYVALILHYCPFLKNCEQKFIALNLDRKDSEIGIENSIIYTLKLPSLGKEDLTTWVGWEKNERDKMGPRMANMKNVLDPKVLAENAVNLNLKLMKWRLLPDIDLEKIQRTKCLLLGSGTLGCSVARNLLAWGVKNIDFVDNSTVSFSNPVRQTLFTYEDSVNMLPKAEAAVKNLKYIFPGVNSKGYQLHIPMPGHSVGESAIEQTIRDVDTLSTLIKDHDVIFLLMDSRESRWLPTMLGSFYGKVVINAALGFDSYLVMRHGCRTENLPDPNTVTSMEGYKVIQGENLGCYFCNDVTAPGDSMRNKTLDQQCTVTRPGVSQIAGALAVELTVSILQHEKGLRAPAFYKTTPQAEDLNPEVENQCLLGLIPHSIRGFLSSFSQILPATLKYNQCVACSEVILKEYETEGFEFLLKVFNSSKHLEDITKLTEMLNEIDLEQVMEFSDSDFE